MVYKKKGKSAKTSEPTIDTNDPRIKPFLKFYNIEIKTEDQLAKMSDKQVRQYKCRVRRWESLIDTQIEFEIYRSLRMFSDLNEAVRQTEKKIKKMTAVPDFDDKDDEYKQSVDKDRRNVKEVMKHLETSRKTFDELYEEHQAMKVLDKEKRIKEEAIEDLMDVSVKEEPVSEESDSEFEIKEEIEIKEEYVSDEEMSDEDKQKVRKAIKAEADVKPRVKREIKSEFKPEIKDEKKFEVKVKKEYISSDDE